MNNSNDIREDLYKGILHETVIMGCARNNTTPLYEL